MKRNDLSIYKNYLKYNSDYNEGLNISDFQVKDENVLRTQHCMKDADCVNDLLAITITHYMCILHHHIYILCKFNIKTNIV